MADDLCRELDQYVDPPTPQPTIDLRRCKPGDRARLRNGKTVVYAYLDNHPCYRHILKDVENRWNSGFTDDGRFYVDLVRSDYDVVELLSSTPSTNQSPTEETLKAEFLQHLYAQSGRTCGTFSGLWAEFRRQCLQEHLDALAEQLAQEKRRVWGEQRRRAGDAT